MLGRVSSLDWLISIGLLPLSFALTGPVSAAIGAQATLVAAGALGAVVTLSALFLPGMRAVEGRAPLREPRPRRPAREGARRPTRPPRRRCSGRRGGPGTAPVKEGEGRASGACAGRDARALST